MQPGLSRAAVLDESDLVRRLRAGDDVAYELLVRTYSGRLLAVTRRILGSEDDARDAVQDTFIRAFRHVGSFAGDSRLSTWLHRIAVNTALMKLRSRRRRPEEPIDALLPAFQDDGHHVEQFRSWDEAADETFRRGQLRTLVRQCIERLPENYRTVLLLRDIEQMDSEEAAGFLGISVNAVKIRLHRARQALRTLLDPHYHGGLA